MDHQDLRRSPSSAVHGAHVCNKCGWSFPNPHPSAKHRRAHKKICGTIQGFKVNNTQHSVSDGEQSDEEEPKTPSPKVLQQRTMYEKGSGVISGASMKSDDGLYLDAVAEFSDTCSAPGTGEGLQESQEGFANKDLSAIPFQSDEGTIGNTGTQLQEGLSTPYISSKTSYASGGRNEGSNVKYEMVTDASDDIEINATESMIDSCLTSVDQVSEVRGITVNNLDKTIGSQTSSILDGRIEKSNGLGDRNGLEDEHPIEYETVENASTTSSIGKAVGSDVLLGDRNGSEDDLHPIKHDFITDAPEDIKKTDPTDSMIVGCLTSIDKDSEVRGITATHLDEVASQTCEGASKLKVTDRMTSEHLQADEVAPSEKEHSDGFGMHIPQMDLPSEVKSISHLSTSVDTAKEVDHNLIESIDWNPNVHVLSVPSDINVVDDPVLMLEDFRDHKGKRLDQFTSLDSWEQFDDNEKDLKQPVLMESLNSFQSSHLSRGSIVSSDTHNLEASVEPDIGSNGPINKSVPVEEANMSKSDIKMSENQIPDERGTSADAVMPQIAKTYMVSLPEGQDSYDKSNESLLLNVAANDAGIDKNIHLVGPEDDEKDGNCDVKGESKDHCRKGPVEENFLGNPMATVHSDGGRYESQIDPAAYLDKDDNDVGCKKGSKFGDAGCNDEAETLNLCKDDRSKGAIENYSTDDASNLEYGSCLSKLHVNPLANPQEGGDVAGDRENDKTEKYGIEESILVKSELDPKCSVIVDGSKDVDEATDGSKMELVETRGSNLGSSSNLAGKSNDSDTQRDVLEKEISSNDNIQKEAVTGLAAGSDLSHNVEPFQNSVENLGMREPGFSAVDTKSSVQSFIASEDSSSRESRVVAFEFTSQSLQEEGDNNLVKKQPSPTAIDILVDSNSQTDSLEANWGSVSVLSMQSDAGVVPRMQFQASVDENTDMKKSKTENESQYSDKSDVFEAPSFMTLVEPGGGNNKNATGSEILTAVHNPEQQKTAPLQTGWFPSMTHVVNESQGRKKNEEIIAKVTNWSAGKQHTPLKSLLGEASLQSRGKSPNQNKNVSPALPKDDKASKVSGPVVTKVNSILNPESPTGEAGKKDNAKEWNSPARYPSDAKGDKKKVRGRPSWVHFVCCSSVN